MTKTPQHIAVVDDEEPVRKALMRLMRSAGLNAETFGSGPEFLKSLDTRLPDCVVLDLHMPQMDGFHVQAHLARKHAAVLIIVITGPWRRRVIFQHFPERSGSCRTARINNTTRHGWPREWSPQTTLESS